MNKDAVPYKVVRLISRGGMGSVYEGRANLPSGVSVPVAIKLVRRDVANYRDAKRLLLNEARTALALNHNHPNLVTTYACHATGNEQPYLVMEWVDGTSVDKLVRRELSDGEQYFAVMRRIACGVLSALQYLHSHGVIHRDVSPGNILLGRNGAVKLTDMGLCKALEAERSHGFVGTPPYACPEALRGGKHTERFDLFSLATVLYELLTGEPPFGTGEPDAIFRRMMDQEAELTLPDDVPSDLSTLVTTLLTVEGRQTKLQSATECFAFLQTSGEKIAGDAQMGAVVAQIAAHTQAATENKHTTIPVLFAPRPGRMLRWALAGGAAALIFALGLAGGSVLNRPIMPGATGGQHSLSSASDGIPASEVANAEELSEVVCESRDVVVELDELAKPVDNGVGSDDRKPCPKPTPRKARTSKWEMDPSRGMRAWRSY